MNATGPRPRSEGPNKGLGSFPARRPIRSATETQSEARFHHRDCSHSQHRRRARPPRRRDRGRCREGPCISAWGPGRSAGRRSCGQGLRRQARRPSGDPRCLGRRGRGDEAARAVRFQGAARAGGGPGRGAREGRRVRRGGAAPRGRCRRPRPVRDEEGRVRAARRRRRRRGRRRRGRAARRVLLRRLQGQRQGPRRRRTPRARSPMSSCSARSRATRPTRPPPSARPR